MRTKLIAVVTFAFLVVGGTARANDSIARVGAGSIALVKSEQIRMVQEFLEISPSVVRVKYKFLNESANDIRTTVAFPMPAYGWNPGESAVDQNVGPLKSFKLLVGGVAVPTQSARKAVVGARDITDQLRAIGLTESQIFDTFGDCGVAGGYIKCDLSKAQESEIARLLGNSYSNAGWKVEETAYWEQVFPAGKMIEVMHEYQPFVGMSYTAPYQQGFGYVGAPPIGDLPTAAWLEPKAAPDEACLDDGTRAALGKRIRSLVENGARMVWVTLNDVEYILGTGRNWKGPITDFKLRIEKASPDQFVSLCFPGKPKKLNPMVLEFSHTNYVPQDRLIVHFYTVKGEMN